MPFLILLLAVVMAVGVFFSVSDAPTDAGYTVDMADVPWTFRNACTAEPEMCACVFPMLRYIGANEDLSAFVRGTHAGLGASRSLIDLTYGWLDGSTDPEVVHWYQVTERDLDSERIFGCVHRVQWAEEQAAGNTELPSFHDAVDSYAEER